MNVALLKEKQSDNRVAITPEGVSFLNKNNLKVMIEIGIGENLGLTYSNTNFKNREKILSQADVFITFNPLEKKDISNTKNNAVFISRFAPYDNSAAIDIYQKKSHTVYSLDMIPRITIAQSSDVLSSLASLSGYKAVLTATQYFPRYFPMLTTAAGTITPAKIMVIGAGVAGLQAIATAKRLGAVVSAFDTRAAAKNEVMSLGAKFIEVEGAKDDDTAGGYAVEQNKDFQEKQKQEIFKNIVKSDIVIATAQIRGRPAPRLISKEMVAKMAPGSVIVDLASATGGNCELSQDGKVVEEKGVTIVGDSDLSRNLPYHASILYSRNVINFLKFMVKEDHINLLSPEHEVVKKSCVVFKGKKAEWNS